MNEPTLVEVHADVTDLRARGLEEHEIASLQTRPLVDALVTGALPEFVLQHGTVRQSRDFLEGPTRESRAVETASRRSAPVAVLGAEFALCVFGEMSFRVLGFPCMRR